MSTRDKSSARRWALALCAGLCIASGCRQILGVEDPVPCESSAECSVEGEPCVAGECVDGACAYSTIAAGSPAATDVPGDCSQPVCDDSGQATTVVDPDDAPADDTPGDCMVPACDAEGGLVTAPAETDVATDMNPGDCKAPGCDADGNVIDVDDPSDCSCEVGATVTCYDGPADTEGKGPCSSGMADCEAGGVLGECLGQVLPAPDSCLTASVDEDCSGANNACVGSYVWSYGFGGPALDGAGVPVYLQSDDPFGGDVLANVLFTQSVNIDGTTVAGSANLESALVRITREGEVTPGPHYAATVSSLTRRAALVFAGGKVDDGASETFGAAPAIAPIGSDDAFVAAFNTADMSLAWKQRIFSSGDDSVKHVVPRPGGGVVVQGRTQGSVVFAAGGPAFAALGSSDEFLVAYSATGTVDWVTRWPASTFTVADVAVDPENGNLFVCSSSSSPLVVTDPQGAKTLHTPAGGAGVDAWVFRVDGPNGGVSSGNIVRFASAGSDRCDAVTILPDGGRAIAGSVTTNVTVGAVTLNHTDSVADGFVMTTSQSGTPLNAKMLDITAGSVNIVSIDAPSDGSIVVGGWFIGGSLQVGAADPIDAPSGRSDLFIAKFSPSLSEMEGWPLHFFASGGDAFMTALRVGPDFGITATGTMSAGFSVGGPPMAFVASQDAFVFRLTQ